MVSEQACRTELRPVCIAYRADCGLPRPAPHRCYTTSQMLQRIRPQSCYSSGSIVGLFLAPSPQLSKRSHPPLTYQPQHRPNYISSSQDGAIMSTPSAYKELTGKTRNERRSECPPDYWCFDNEGSELWANPHGFFCPRCKCPAVDTSPFEPVFMCPNCGLHFGLEGAQDIPRRAMVEPYEPSQQPASHT